MLGHIGILQVVGMYSASGSLAHVIAVASDRMGAAAISGVYISRRGGVWNVRIIYTIGLESPCIASNLC